MAKPKQSSWLETSTDRPLTENVNAPVFKADGWKFRWARRALFTIAFIGVPLSIFILIGNAVGAGKSDNSTSAVTSVSVNGSAGKAPAYLAVEAWLAANPSPLPDGSIVSWSGFETVEPVIADGDKAPTYTTEIHHFVLTSGGQLFDTSVEVLIDPVQGAKVTSTPTLLPVLASGDWNVDTTWAGWNATQASSAVTDTVEAWATAFTSGKPESLRLAVGDPSSAHSYLPLSGGAVDSVSVTAAAALPAGDGTKVTSPKQIIVRVTVGILWGGATKTPGSASFVTYDLLVDAADTATPRVVAWGGPGSGPTLTKYMNAVNASSIQVDEVKSTPTPTPTPTGGTSG